MFQLSGFYIMFRAAVPAVHGLGGARMALLGLTVSRRVYRCFNNYRKGSCKGAYKGYYNIGAVIIRIGFWDPLLYYSYNGEPQNSICNI